MCRVLVATVAGLGVCLACADDISPKSFYRLESTIGLPSKSPSWDYLAMDESNSRLFIARRDDGAAVVDVENQQFVATIERSEGANAIVLVPAHERGFTINRDGSATVFDLSSLKTLDRITFGDNADTAAFDAATNQLVVMMGGSQAVAFLDAATGALIDTLDMNTDKMEAPTPDGTGNFFTALRNEDAIAKVDARLHTVVARWKLEDCGQPSGLALDVGHQRLFAGCRGYGEHPLLAVIDANSGKVITTLENGRGNDGVIYDDQLHRVFASNGVDANLVIYGQLDADNYEFLEAATTRPYARTMAMDHRSGKVYLVTAEGTVDPSRKRNRGPASFYPNHYFADTFAVLTFSSR